MSQRNILIAVDESKVVIPCSAVTVKPDTSGLG